MAGDAVGANDEITPPLLLKHHCVALIPLAHRKPAGYQNLTVAISKINTAI
jgi:hypothetical protein